MTDKSKLKTAAIFYAAFLFFFLIVYHSVLTHSFAYTDDYAVVFYVFHHQYRELANGIVSGGRPIYALLNALFYLTPSISSLRWIRLLSLAGIAASCVLAAKIFIEFTNLPRFLSIATALCIGLMPAFQVYASWAVTAFYPWSAFLALLGFYIYYKSDDNDLRAFLFSILIVCSSIMIYQPSAMMYWIGVAAAWIVAEKPQKSIKKLFLVCAVMGIALVLDFAATKTLPHLIFGDDAAMGRTTLVSNYGQKAVWFITKALKNSLDLASIKAHPIVSIITGCFITSGVLLSILKNRSHVLVKIIVALGLIPLCYLPNLIVQESWASFRSEAALTTLLLLYLAVATNAWTKQIRISALIPALSVGFVLLSSAIAFFNVATELAIPQAEELHMVSRYLRTKPNLANMSQIYLVPSSWQDSLAPFIRYEFGIPSSMDSWVPQGMVWLLLKERNPEAAKVIVNATVGPLDKAPPGATILNLGDAFKGR